MGFQTENWEQLASDALRKYDLGTSCKAKLLQISENVTFLVLDEKSGSPLSVMRIGRPGYHTAEELDGELLWVSKIREETPLAVPGPIPGRDGACVQEVTGRGFGFRYTVVMYEFLTGSAPDEENEESSVLYFRKLGEATAVLHRQVKNWGRSNELKRFTWNCETMIGDHARWGSWKACRELTDQTTAALERTCGVIRRRLAAYGTSKERFGLIHADLRLSNLLIEGGRIKIIDFDDCGFGWFLHDLAAAVSFIETKPSTPKLIAAWLEGYQTTEILSPEDLDEIDTFIMQRRLQLLAWIASHSDSHQVSELGKGFTQGTVAMAEHYLSKYA